MNEGMQHRLFRGSLQGMLLIVLFHTVGLAGFLSAKWAPLFELLVPWHLLLMLGIVLHNHRPKNKAFFTVLFLLMAAGWFIEWLGVRTGKIFGQYQYGATLGFAIDGIPLMIGVNWFLLVYSVYAIIRPIKSTGLKLLAGAAMLVLLDYFIEPVAIRFHYWHWQGGKPGLQNYIGWFAVSFVFLLMFRLAGQKAGRHIGTTLYFTQLGFFIVLSSGGKNW